MRTTGPFAPYELREDLERAIAELPVDQRFLVSAHYFGGQQYLWAVVDLNSPVALLAAALEAPEAMTVVTVLAVCLAWVQMRREPEDETL